jgi:NAD(P)-dependent dehydrogenase (short-subunit alcohol dehydrogenase family)
MDKNGLSEEAATAADLMRTADKARDRAHALRHDADGRIRSTADILRPVAHFLAADASSYITGQVRRVSGGVGM